MDQRRFLGVEKSVSGRAWVDRLDAEALRLASAITQQSGLSQIVARILAARGVGVEDPEQFLNPTIRDLMPDPDRLTDMGVLVDRLASAILRREKIAVFGDYDVDGATSVALFERYLCALGCDPVVYIPDRIFEGYGPNISAMDQLADAGVGLVITVDCGTTAHEAVAHAESRGMDLLIIDHHLPDGDLPDAYALVNPNRPDDLSSLGYLCAAGVCFMVLAGLNRKLRTHGVPLPDPMATLDLVALGTVCDVVPLVALNRAFVRRGIEILRRGGNTGLTALTMAARVSGPLNPYHLGFVIGPRINAGGRLGDAALGARLLATNDAQEAMDIASRLDQLNAERQMIEKRAVEEAIAVGEAEIGDGPGPPVLVMSSPDWHQGIVGLIAARLKERFSRPAFAIAQKPDGRGVGSGRSVAGVDLGAAVHAAIARGVLSKGGGHAMAAGISIEPGQTGAFRTFMAERLQSDVEKAGADRVIKVDAALTARAASVGFVQEFERAGPYGPGNPEPLFALPAHRVTYSETRGVGGHVKASLVSQDRARINAIAFRAADTALGAFLLAASNSNPIHVVGSLSINHWRGRGEVQFRIIDAAPTG